MEENAKQSTFGPSHPHGNTPEHAILQEIAGALRELQDAVSEMRSMLAGTTKSHYTTEEFARIFGRAPYTVREWVKHGKLRAERVAGTGPRGRLLIPREELKRLIAEGKGEAVPEAAVGHP